MRPSTTPLRAGVDVALPLPAATKRVEQVGLYRASSDGWEWVGSRVESGRIGGSTRHLGTFAVFRDTRAPRVTMLDPAPRDTASGYSKWALEVALAENGSGVDVRATHFVVDGKRVPSEWDGVVSGLRWKPLAPPAVGSHRFSVIAVDRAGNTRKVDGRFVVK